MTQSTNELKAGVIFGRFVPVRAELDAMRLVTHLVNSGAVALVDDQYHPGLLAFRCLKIGKGAADVFSLSDTSEVPGAEPMTATQGEAMSVSLAPLESAIESTVRMLGDEHQRMVEAGVQGDTALCDRLGSHLDALLAVQVERMTAYETV